MGTVGDRVLELLGPGVALDDDEIAGRLGVIRQHVNQACRRLEKQGLIVRETGWRGKIINRRTDMAPAAKPVRAASAGLVTEDDVKAAVQGFLEEQGYSVRVAWGHERGIDIEAHHPEGRIFIEAKGDAPTPHWEERRLIVEVDEEQHQEETPFFDKPDRMTVSGVRRGTQRRMYDERKRQAAREQGYTVVEITWSRRRKPKSEDLKKLRSLLEVEGILGLSSDGASGHS